MKKAFFYFTAIIMATGFATGISHAQTATPSQTDIDAQSAVILKQSLDILEGILWNVENRIQAGENINTAELAQMLGALQTALIQTQSLLGQSAHMAINEPAAPAAPAPVSKPAAPVAQAPAPAIPNPAPADLSALPPIPAAPSQEPIASQNPNTASALSSIQRNIFWPSLALVIVLAIIFVLRLWEERKVSPQTSTAEEVPAPTSSKNSPAETPIMY